MASKHVTGTAGMSEAAAPDASPKLSLVLATRGEGSGLPRLFASLAAQTEPGFEVIIVDQNNDDRLAAPLADARALGLNLTHLHQREANLSAARNLGTANARAPIVGFPDDDCWYHPACLAQVAMRACAATASPTNTYESSAAVGAASVVSNPTASPLASVVAHWVESPLAGNAPAASALQRERWRAFHGGDASSIALFIRREALNRVGGFDPLLGVGRYFGAGEETDLVLRLLDAGEPLLREPGAIVHHAPPGGLTGGVQGFAAVRQRARGTGAIYAKHRLAWPIILRGLLGPWPAALRNRPGPAAITQAAAVTLGRLEGLMALARATASVMITPTP
ncbi:MAG: glycosyltransferase [Burkholderiaceae bacterium]